MSIIKYKFFCKEEPDDAIVRTPPPPPFPSKSGGMEFFKNGCNEGKWKIFARNRGKARKGRGVVLYWGDGFLKSL